MTGTWVGTVTSPEGATSELSLVVAHDSLRGMTLITGTGRGTPVVRITNLSREGARLQWTQELSGASCKADAVLTAATALDRGVVAGKFACTDGLKTFVLRKTAE